MKNRLIPVTSSSNDTTYLFDPTLHREFQSLHLRATNDATWIVDGKPVSREWCAARGGSTHRGHEWAGSGIAS